ncbi:hepatocyte growth factor receptor [Plakobranchus ocellatus]|uniref:receptor protein-tyrosine kinase n=1 Tax=Plakobranchus ocellatus TaxID=259542 RepID=A0AAV4CM98_9GAST|nr:hepatocyte growth factor receptor [Plakobranchus ocellatus]
MYVSNGHRIVSLSLDYCRQFRTCETCVASVPCLWCPMERSCLGEESTEIRCLGSESNKCPPSLDSFKPTTVPTDGGSVLTLYGNQLGTMTDEYSKVVVSICGQPCDNVKATGTNVTCTVRKKCSLCQDSCRVNVSVEIRSLPSKYNLMGGNRLTYVKPNVLDFHPEYGPVSGRTLVSLSGRHLDSGSNCSVKVVGVDCNIADRNKSAILCNIVGNKETKPGCGFVDLSIDDFHTNVYQVNFCLRPDPIIQTIAPLRSIESGGIVITIKGSHLDSVTLRRLELRTTLDSQDLNETLLPIFVSHCTLPNGGGELMTCPSPSIQSFDALTRRISSGAIDKNGKHLSLDLRLVLDGRNVLQDVSDLPHKFVVYSDPTLFGFTPGTEDAFVDVRNPVLKIRGENLPTWIPYSDIRVTIANWTCPLTSVTQNLVTCDGKEVAQFVLANKDRLVTEPTQMMITKVTTMPSSKNSRLNIPNGLKQKAWKTMSPVVATVTEYFNSAHGFIITAKPSKRGRKRNSNKRLSGSPQKTRHAIKSAKLERSDVSLPKPPMLNLSESNHELKEIMEGPMGTFSKEYEVEIKIGFLTRSLGKIQVGFDPKRLSPNESSNFRLWKVAGPVAVAAILVLLLVAALVLCCQLVKTRSRAKKKQEMASLFMDNTSVSASPGSTTGWNESTHPTLNLILESIMDPRMKSEVDNLIIKPDRLAIGKSIGSGNFGCVYEGLLMSDDGNTTQRVAIKTLQDSASQSLNLKGFVEEALIMKDFHHPHVLGLIGLAERAAPEGGAPYVIIPYMEHGDLLTYIKDTSVSLSLHDVIKFGADIASGMTYLSNLRLVHRDLAARNCMLDNLQRVKVADFGLCRDIYEKGYYTSDNRKKLPIRWMAIESIEHGAYSTKSDVWSFGVVLWEMSCRGVTPYPGVDGWDVINYLRRRRLPPPLFCPNQLYNIMLLCWNKDPDSRPEFQTLNAHLLFLIGQRPPGTGASDIDALKTSSNLEQHVKLPKVAGPIDKAAKKRQSPNSLQKKDANQHLSMYQNVPFGREPVEVYMEAAECYAVTESVLDPQQVVIRNVQITIPACHSHRDLNQSTEAEYVHLVDNYEPVPIFTDYANTMVVEGRNEPAEVSTDTVREGTGYLMPKSIMTKLDVSDHVDSHPEHSSLVLDGAYDMPRNSGVHSSDANERGNYLNLKSFEGSSGSKDAPQLSDASPYLNTQL